ncbi:MAG: signal peptidase II, partial [Gemmatimonadaceae bacterium]
MSASTAAENSERDSVRNVSVAIASSPTSPVIFWGIIALVVALDIATKSLAVSHLMPRHVPHNIIGEYVRFTLAYNPGAAFGFNLGPASRWIFAALSVVIVFALMRWTRQLVAISK